MPDTVRTLALAAALAAFAPPMAFASGACDFYAGSGYSGEAFTLYSGHVLLTDAVDPQLVASITGGTAYQSFTDPRWKGRVASVRVQPGCTATMSDGSSRPQYATDTSNIGAYRAIAYACVCR